MRKVSILMVVALIVSAVAVTAEAQERRQGGQRGGQDGQRGGQGGQRGGFGQRGFGGPGGFMGGGGGLLALASMEAVQKETEMLEDQVKEVEKVREEMRTRREAQREAGGERPDFRNMSDEQRQQFMEEMRKRGEEETKISDAKVCEICLPHQVDRMRQIQRQIAGVRALMMPDVAAKLGLSDAAQKKIQETLEQSQTSMRERMGEIMRGGNRENMGEQFAALRKEMDGKVLGLLTQSQKDEFEKLKGKPFEMPQRGFGGRGGGRGGEDRPQRPQRPDV